VVCLGLFNSFLHVQESPHEMSNFTLLSPLVKLFDFKLYCDSPPDYYLEELLYFQKEDSICTLHDLIDQGVYYLPADMAVVFESDSTGRLTVQSYRAEGVSPATNKLVHWLNGAEVRYGKEATLTLLQNGERSVTIIPDRPLKVRLVGG